jgi:hypothetical protein
MTFRRRKRIRGLILALATAAVLVPAANGYVYLGGQPRADYSGLTPQALQALNERWTKLAERYQQLGASATVGDLVDRQVANIERHSSQAVRPDDGIGIRGTGPVETPALVASHDDGFDWTDAGIGASTTLVVAALLAGAVATRRRTGLAA